MKSYITITLLIITLFSGCDVVFKSRSTKPSHEKIYLYAQACDLNQSKAKEAAVEALEEKSALASISEFSSLNFKKENNSFCYEASVNEHEWAPYINSLVKRRHAIIQETQEQNSTRFYSEKSSWINTLLDIRTTFNLELTSATKIAPVATDPFDLNSSKLAMRLNTKPSIKMDYIPCKNHSNFKCQLRFISKAKDEDTNLSYRWDFGDGSVSQHKNPLYTYNEEGDFNVSLHVTDTDEATSTLSTMIKVAKLRKPIVKFITKKDVYKTGESIAFINHSHTLESKIKTYHWNFGDGVRSSRQNPKHTYHKRGRYVVSLKVCNKNKFCNTASKKLRVEQGKSYINVTQGMRIDAYIAEKGEPKEKIVKQKALMSAYRYGDIWLLCKRGKIECAVEEEGLAINLLGQPKKCYWHEKHAKEYMVELK